MKTAILRHLQVLFDTLGKMARVPLASIMTIAVLGIAIALPLILFKISDSLVRVTDKWQGGSQVTVFLRFPEQNQDQSSSRVIDDMSMDFGRTLLKMPNVRDVEYISPQQAMMDFQESSGFGDLLEGLPENPLPPLLVVSLETEVTQIDIDALVANLGNMPEVDSISYDQLWLERLSAIIDLFRFAVLVLSVLMATGVILIISNTVRLGILSRSEEIEIIDQIGGTSSFIRRPFLYYGVLQGIAGALTALLIANFALHILGKPVERLAKLYDSNLRVDWIDFSLSWVVVLIAVVLGWVAARFTVGNYLRKLRATARGK